MMQRVSLVTAVGCNAKGWEKKGEVKSRITEEQNQHLESYGQ